MEVAAVLVGVMAAGSTEEEDEDEEDGVRRFFLIGVSSSLLSRSPEAATAARIALRAEVVVVGKSVEFHPSKSSSFTIMRSSYGTKSQVTW